MPRVFVDPSAVVLPTLPSDDPGGPQPHLAPGAAAALRHLTEADCEVVLLDPPAVVKRLPPGVQVAPELPRPLGPDAWFVTADPTSRFGRPRGARTILVGPKRAPGPIPLPRYDVEARDLSAAVMEILTHQAMV